MPCGQEQEAGIEKEHLTWASTPRGTWFLPSFLLECSRSSAARLQNIPGWGRSSDRDLGVTAPPDAARPSSVLINETSEQSLSAAMSL